MEDCCWSIFVLYIQQYSFYQERKWRKMEWPFTCFKCKSQNTTKRRGKGRKASELGKEQWLEDGKQRGKRDWMKKMTDYCWKDKSNIKKQQIKIHPTAVLNASL